MANPKWAYFVAVYISWEAVSGGGTSTVAQFDVW